MKKKIIITIIACVLVFTCFLTFLTLLVAPKYQVTSPEGSMVSEYYDDEKNNEVIFFGDCEAYEVFSPVTLWENYGITSYVRGSSQQMIWLSYYMLEDTLKYETPKVVVLSVCDMMHADPDSTDSSEKREAYNRMTLDGMRWSATKWNAIEASMTSEEREKSGIWSYIFPVLRYHSRILELEEEDWDYLFKRNQVTDNGYMMQVNIKAVGSLPAESPKLTYEFSDMCFEYLDRITQLCEEKDIELLLVKSPTLSPVWYDEYEEQIQTYATEHSLKYVNLIEKESEIGLDWDEDTCDGGFHLNVYGAEKVSKYIGKILTKEYNLVDYSTDKDVSKIWIQKSDDYAERKKALETERDKKTE